MYYGLISSMSKTVASAYTARTTAFITATGITDTTIINALNTMDLSLISAGLDTKMKALYPFVGGTASTHKYNFMDARDLDVAFRIAFNGGWTHSSTGALPNGVNAFADTYLNPSISLSQNNCGFSYYSRTNRSLNYGAIGVYSPANYQFCIILRDLTNNIYNRLATTVYAGDAYSCLNSNGFYTSTRSISSYSKLFRNGTSLGNGAVTSTGLPNGTFYIGGLNYIGSLVAQYPDNEEFAFNAIHNGLTDGEAATFYTITQTFQTSLSRQV